MNDPNENETPVAGVVAGMSLVIALFGWGCLAGSCAGAQSLKMSETQDA